MINKIWEGFTTEERVEHIASMARELIELAEDVGVTLRVSHRPRQPLAMGHFDHVVEAYPARHGPRAQPAPEGKE